MDTRCGNCVHGWQGRRFVFCHNAQSAGHWDWHEKSESCPQGQTVERPAAQEPPEDGERWREK